MADEPISRRDLLRGLGRRLRPPSPPAPPSATGRVHRPPGAVDEPDFLRDCTRCGDCIAACPVSAIVKAPPRYGAAAGTPMIDPVTAPCVVCDDPPCIHACEPGVLTFAAPLRMGTASIRRPHCLAYQGSVCTVCSERCPVPGAITVQGGLPVIHEPACTGCGVCQHVCPAPYNAVLILPAERGAAETPSGPGPAPRDWRAEYFGGRSLAPPDQPPPGHAQPPQ